MRTVEKNKQNMIGLHMHYSQTMIKLWYNTIGQQSIYNQASV